MSSFAPEAPAVAASQPAPAPAVETVTPIDPAAPLAPEPTEAEPAAGEEPPRDPASGRFAKRTDALQRQIDELTATKRSEERNVQGLRAEAHRLRQELNAPSNLDPADYDGQQMLNVRKAVKAERLEQMEMAAEQVAQTAASRSAEIVGAQAGSYRESIPDIDVIFSSPAQGGPVVTDMMTEALSRAPNGALVAYHLAKNPAVNQRIVQMERTDPVGALMELASLSSQLSNKPIRRISQAPQPVQTVSGGAGGAGGVDLSTADFATYEKIRMGQQ